MRLCVVADVSTRALSECVAAVGDNHESIHRSIHSINQSHSSRPIGMMDSHRMHWHRPWLADCFPQIQANCRRLPTLERRPRAESFPLSWFLRHSIPIYRHRYRSFSSCRINSNQCNDWFNCNKDISIVNQSVLCIQFYPIKYFINNNSIQSKISHSSIQSNNY